MDRLQKIMDAQHESMKEFGKIEVENGLGLGLLPSEWNFDPRRFTGSHDIDHPNVQYVLKDYAWRVTEELVEFAREKTGDARKEELIDALHFLVEMMLIAGLRTSDQVYTLATEPHERLIHELWPLEEIMSLHVDQPMLRWQDVTAQLAEATHLLRNRPWKQSRRPTEKNLFLLKLAKAFRYWVAVATWEGLSGVEIHRVYTSKNQVNKERIEDGS